MLDAVRVLNPRDQVAEVVDLAFDAVVEVAGGHLAPWTSHRTVAHELGSASVRSAAACNELAFLQFSVADPGALFYVVAAAFGAVVPASRSLLTWPRRSPCAADAARVRLRSRHGRHDQCLIETRGGFCGFRRRRFRAPCSVLVWGARERRGVGSAVRRDADGGCGTGRHLMGEQGALDAGSQPPSVRSAHGARDGCRAAIDVG